MLAKIALTLAVIGIVFFFVKKIGPALKKSDGGKGEASRPRADAVLDLEACSKCGGYHEGGTRNCPSDV